MGFRQFESRVVVTVVILMVAKVRAMLPTGVASPLRTFSHIARPPIHQLMLPRSCEDLQAQKPRIQNPRVLDPPRPRLIWGCRAKGL